MASFWTIVSFKLKSPCSFSQKAGISTKGRFFIWLPVGTNMTSMAFLPFPCQISPVLARNVWSLYLLCWFPFIFGELSNLQKVVFFLNILLPRELIHAYTDRFF